MAKCSSSTFGKSSLVHIFLLLFVFYGWGLSAFQMEFGGGSTSPDCPGECVLIGQVHISPKGLEKILASSISDLSANIASYSELQSQIPLSYEYTTPDNCEFGLGAVSEAAQRMPASQTALKPVKKPVQKPNTPTARAKTPCLKLPPTNPDGSIPLDDLGENMRPFQFAISDGKLSNLQLAMVGTPKCDKQVCQVVVGIKSAEVETTMSVKEKGQDGFIMRPSSQRIVLRPNRKGEIITLTLRGRINSTTGRLEDLIAIPKGSSQLSIPEGTMSLESVFRDQSGKEKSKNQMITEGRSYVYKRVEEKLRPFQAVAQKFKGVDAADVVLDREDIVEGDLYMEIHRQTYDAVMKSEAGKAHTACIKSAKPLSECDRSDWDAEWDKTEIVIRAQILQELRSIKLGKKSVTDADKFLSSIPERLDHSQLVQETVKSSAMDYLAYESGFTSGHEGDYYLFSTGQRILNMLTNVPEFTNKIEELITPHLTSLEDEVNRNLQAMPEYFNQTGIIQEIEDLPTPAIQDFVDRAHLYESLETVRETIRSTEARNKKGISNKDDPKMLQTMRTREGEYVRAIAAIDRRLEGAYHRMHLSVAVDKATKWGAKFNIVHNEKDCINPPKLPSPNAEQFEEDLTTEIPVSALNHYLKVMNEAGLLQFCDNAQFSTKGGVPSTTHHEPTFDKEKSSLSQCPKGATGIKMLEAPSLRYENGQYTMSTEQLRIDGSKYSAELKVKPEMCNGTLCFKLSDPSASAKNPLWLIGAGGFLEAALQSASEDLSKEGIPGLDQIPFMKLQNIRVSPNGSLRMGWEMTLNPPPLYAP